MPKHPPDWKPSPHFSPQLFSRRHYNWLALWIESLPNQTFTKDDILKALGDAFDNSFENFERPLFEEVFLLEKVLNTSTDFTKKESV